MSDVFRILIVDDHPMMSAALAGVLRDLRPRVDCHCAASGAEARRMLAGLPAVALIVLDLALPDADGFELLGYLREVRAGTPVLVVSASEEVDDMRRALAAGAAGYVSKSGSPAELRAAATKVLRQEVVVPPALRWPLGAAGAHAGAPPDAGVVLNERQLDVLRLVCAGRSNKFIAYELGIAEKTVKGRVTAIFRALGVDNRTQAVLKAAQLGLFKLADAPPPAEPADG